MMQRLFAVALSGLVLAVTSGAQAQDAWPSKPVKILVGLAPGGGTDIQARLFSQKLSADLGRPFLVENRPGAGEIIAIQATIASSPDGYTVLATTPSLTVGPAFYDKPLFDPVKDLAPVSLVTKAPYLLVVPGSSPYKSVNELLTFAKSSPSALNFGTSGAGTPIQLGAAWIASVLGTPVTIINYKGTGPVLTALLANEIHVSFANPISALTHVKSGKLRALAVTSLERSKVFPDLPSVAESGVSGLDVSTWHGWLVPKATPPAVIGRMNAALVKMIQSRDIADRLLAEGGEPVGSTPELLAQVIATELPRWKKLVKDSGLKME
jgi:tripartite-type tricarboxylate transporter receptor subunit TctC